jgi:NAD(P)-dependent dehydrogenase (short-subunit alcohol dehydrogenase family)
MQKVVVVTGAIGGMGSATCEALKSENYFVIGVDRVEELKVRNVDKYFAGDVSDEKLWLQVTEFIRNQFTQCDGLVNIAGINYLSKVSEADLDRWREMFNVNVVGMVAGIKHISPLMGRGSNSAIVNMSSIAAQIGSDGYSAYTATKGAVDSLTKALALELAPDIRINAVAPGWIETPFTLAGLNESPDPALYRKEVEAMHALGRVGTPDEIANVIVWLLSGKSSFLTGTTVTADGGYLIKN